MPARLMSAAPPAHRHQIAIDATIAALASKRFGVVSRSLLTDAGIGDRAIRHRLRAGRLHEIATGLYTVGHHHWRLESMWSAALLAAGPGAALTRRSGAEAQDWLTPQPHRITVSTGAERRTRTLLVRWPDGPDSEVTVHRWKRRQPTTLAPSGLPTLGLDELVLGVAADGTRGQLRAAVRAAEYRRQVTDRSLRRMLGRGRHGSERLRELLDQRVVGTTFLRSALEERALDLILAAGMPLPLTNIGVPEHDPVTNSDFYWRELKLVVEADGPEHLLPAQIQRDREHEAALAAYGITVVRFSQLQIDGQPATITNAMLPWAERARALGLTPARPF